MSKILQWSIVLLGVMVLALTVLVMRLPMTAPEIMVSLVHNEVYLPDAVDAVLPGVLHIKCPRWQGSGFVVAPNIVCTARHVTSRVEDFTLTDSSGNTYKGVKAISSKRHDISFIWVEAELPQPLLLGSVLDMRLGEDIFSIGGPLGVRHFPSITKGVVSNLSLYLEDYNCPEDMGWSILWLNDAATYGGNSGGPIFNMKCEVVGILVGGMGSFESMSYAISTDVFVDDLEQLRRMFIEDTYKVEEKQEVYNGSSM